jgi:hypothetical protein
MKVLANTKTQPANDRPIIAAAVCGLSICHTTAGIGTPLPEQQHERETREQHVGAALDRLGHVLRPPLLELPARHHTMLDGEQRHQQHVDDQRFDQRRRRARVDGLGHHQPSDETNGVENGAEKNQVRKDAVKECEQSCHGSSPRMRDRALSAEP